MRRCQNCLVPWQYVCTVTCSLPEQLVETIVVSCLKKEISGFVYIQSVKISAPCMYRATDLRTLHVGTLKVCQTAWTPVGCFHLRPKKLPRSPLTLQRNSN